MSALALAEPVQAHVDPLATFKLRAQARAMLWAVGGMHLHEAIDGLQADAERDGLIDQVGQDAVQQILADVFEGERLLAEPAPTVPEQTRTAPTRRTEALQVTIDALREAVRERGMTALDGPRNKARLKSLSARQRSELQASLKRMATRAA
jgi:hypothetical protein